MEPESSLLSPDSLSLSHISKQNHMNSVYTYTQYFFILVEQLNIIPDLNLCLPNGLFPLNFRTVNSVCISRLSHTCYIPRQYHLS